MSYGGEVAGRNTATLWVIAIAGAAFLVIGIAMMVWAGAREPTIEHIVAGKDVLSNGDYDLLHTLSLVCMAVGGISGLASGIGLAFRS